jgi:Flp pilus assembly protein TadG
MPSQFPKGIRKQNGNILILTGLSVFMLASFAALALDSSLLYVARNELQNAADAGALAATRVLYLNDGTAVNTGANQIGHDVAETNNSQNSAVEVNWTGGNTGDVERGHWSFATRTFTPNASTLPVDLFNATTAELDANTNFINAVRVTARRQATPVQSILANIFGIDSTAMEADAVAYIGFAGRIQPTEADQPIAICKNRLLINGVYSCSVGTFVPSSDQQTLSETGGWTNFSQENACSGGANANEVKPLVCEAGNPNELILGENLGTIGGQVESAFKPLYDCWDNATTQEEPWPLTLPVIECLDSNVGPCNKLVGAVNVSVLFVLDQANKIDEQAPTRMDCTGLSCNGGGVWENNDPSGIVRWNDFVDTFNLQKPDGTPAYYDSFAPDSGWRQKTIYFAPDCTVHEPTGRTGGENFGVLAKVPVLVE